MSIKEIIARLREQEPCLGCTGPGGRVTLYTYQGTRLATAQDLNGARRIARLNGYKLIER